MFRRFFLKLSAWALNQIYDQEGLIAHHCGELTQKLEIKMFGQGELLGLVQIWPGEKDGYDLETYSKAEADIFSETEIEGLDP